MNSNTANLHRPASTLNPHQAPPRQLSSRGLLPFFWAIKRGDTTTCHEDDVLAPHCRSSWYQLQFSPYAVTFLWVKFQGTLCTRGETIILLLSTVPITNKPQSSVQELIQCASPHAGHWRAEWHFIPPSSSFSISGESPSSQRNPSLSPLSPTAHSISAPAAFRGALRRGKNWKHSTFSGRLFLLPRKEATEEARVTLWAVCSYWPQNWKT